MRPLLAGLAARKKMALLFGLTAVAYLAALNRGQALAWAIAALLAATLLCGAIGPRWLVSGLTVRRRGPLRASEGELVAFSVQVANAGGLPRFMVEVLDHLPFASPATVEGRQVLGTLAYLPGRAAREFVVSVRCEKRGYYRLGPVGLATGFPLGLASARRLVNEGVQTLTIYPEIFAIHALPLLGAPSQIHRGGYLLPEGAGSAEFCGLREYRQGDSPRHIHWPTSARLRELMVREYEPLASACLHLVLDGEARANLGAGRESTFEVAVRIAASMARLACTQALRVRLTGEMTRSLATPWGSGEGHFQALLDQLAVVAADGASSYDRVLDRLLPDLVRGETVVVFLAGPAAHGTPTLLAIAALCQRQAQVLAVLFDDASFDASRAGFDVRARQAALLGVGATTVVVQRGDDLVRRFNP